MTICYQETLRDRDMILEEYSESAKKGSHRPIVVFILRYSPEENYQKTTLLARSTSPKSPLVCRCLQTNILKVKEIRQNHSVYFSLQKTGSKIQVFGKYHYQLDMMDTKVKSKKIARTKILEIRYLLMKDVHGALAKMKCVSREQKFSHSLSNQLPSLLGGQALYSLLGRESG